MNGSSRESIHPGALKPIPEIAADLNAVELLSAWKCDDSIKFLSASVEVWSVDAAVWAGIVAGVAQNVALRFGMPNSPGYLRFLELVRRETM